MSKFTEFLLKIHPDSEVYLQDDISDYVGDSEILEYFNQHIPTEEKLDVIENCIDYELTAQDQIRLLKHIVRALGSSQSFYVSNFQEQALKLITGYYSLTAEEESAILKITSKLL